MLERKGDLLLLVVVILIGVGGVLVHRFYPVKEVTDSTFVYIEQSGSLIGKYSLKGTRDVFSVEGLEGYNVVEIQDNQVRVVEASCPDQICRHFGWIQAPHQVIVCLPHELIIRVVDEEPDEFSLDGITY